MKLMRTTYLIRGVKKQHKFIGYYITTIFEDKTNILYMSCGLGIHHTCWIHEKKEKKRKNT